MKIFCFGVLCIFLISGCNNVNVTRADSFPKSPTKSSPPTIDLNKIDFTTIKHTVPQGRVQDGGFEDENFNKLSITDDLLAHGKDSIPFLIEKLTDETKMERRAMDYWYDVYVGDMALVTLNSFFTESDGLTSTIPGFGWDEFLERGKDKHLMGEQILRRYIKKHGRKNIQERWQKMWDENKDKIYWNEAENCFDLQQ